MTSQRLTEKRRPDASAMDGARVTDRTSHDGPSPSGRDHDLSAAARQVSSRPRQLAPARWMALQRAIGNHAVTQLRGGPTHTTGLPRQLRAGVEALSGVSMHDVRVHHDSPAPARVDALAYTKGADIHVGPGQSRHLPHEAWHVVQQKLGRVRPTVQFKGEHMNTDAALEREADVMGARASQWSEPGPRVEPRTLAGSGQPATPVVQHQGAPVIQAVMMPLHVNARRVSPKGEVYTSTRDENGVKLWSMDFDPKDYPQIDDADLDIYTKAVKADRGADVSSLYEKQGATAAAYEFPDNESVGLHSVHITKGRQIITLTPRARNDYAGRTTKAQALLNELGEGGIGEENPQHIGTHIQGTPPGGTHKHYVATGNSLDLEVVSRMIDRLEDEGLIGAPRVKPTGKPLAANKIDTTMPDSFEVGAKVRARLGVPERTAPKIDLQEHFDAEMLASKQAAKAQAARAKAKNPNES